jgi:hypothetical protein
MLLLPLRFAVYSSGGNLTGGHPAGSGVVLALLPFVPVSDAQSIPG